MFIPNGSAPENHLDLIQRSARRIHQLALANPTRGYLAGSSFERACSDSKPAAVMYDILFGDELSGYKAAGLTDAEAKTAWTLVRASGVDQHMRISAVGQVALRDAVVESARHIVHILKDQDALELALEAV
jgi:hypothetical protein